MRLEDDLLDALAVARISRLVTEDRFPFGALRDHVHEHAGDGPVYRWASDLVSCPWCVSVWVAVGVLIARRLPGWRSLSRVLAWSITAGMIAERSSSGT